MPALLALAAPLLVAACALPLPLQIASWGADGISYVTTHKSVSDHGISAIAGRDCALYRSVTEGAVCRDAAPDGTQLASAARSTATDSDGLVLADTDDAPHPGAVPPDWQVLSRIVPAAGPPTRLAPPAAGGCRAALGTADPATGGPHPWAVLNCVAIAG